MKITQTKPNRLNLIDFDMVVYRIAYSSEDSEWPIVKYNLRTYLSNIMLESGSTHYIGFLTDEDVTKNFRFDVAKSLPYKGNRSNTEKPKWYSKIREELLNNYNVRLCTGFEADDGMSIIQSNPIYVLGNTILEPYVTDKDVLNKATLFESIISTADKDLLQVPGLHYHLNYNKIIEVSYFGTLYLDDKGKLRGNGQMFYYAQMLLGDAIDNIRGIPGLGDKKAYLKLRDCDKVEELEHVVKAEYIKYYAEYYGNIIFDEAKVLLKMLNNPIDGFYSNLQISTLL